MKKMYKFLFLVIAIIIVSCTSVKVVTDQDKSVDFSTYKTYNFLGWQENSDEILNDFDKRRIKDAFVKEFESRGMKFVKENGDVAVTLFIVVDKKTTTTAYTNFYSGGAYRGYHRYGGGWGYGSATTTYSENDYLEGTLVIDVFDNQSKDQVWQGVAKSTVDKNIGRREKSIPNKISALMKKYPVDKLN